jgi:hypothetical protein
MTNTPKPIAHQLWERRPNMATAKASPNAMKRKIRKID